MQSTTRLKTAAAAALALVGMATTSSKADACGGFFCSRSPVDQTAEHIIFTVNDDHTVTAYVQIQYTGDKDDFAWIVPAPGVPTLNTDVPDLAMRGLDTATQPNYFRRSCEVYPPSVGGFNNGAGGATASAPGGVTVLAKQAVGPFDTVTLEGTSADVLVKWLNDNGYRITDKMIPLIQPYVEAGMHFVALKLQADKAVTDIEPLGMRYDGDKPMIPLRLTSVAAQPEMGIVAFILSNRRWAPENYIDLKIPDSLIEFGQYGFSNNYLKVVSSEADKVGGQAFVTEYAKATTDLVTQISSQFVNTSIPDAQKSQDVLLGLLRQYPYITRLYTRMSAEEMTDDPMFMPSSNTADVSNQHDLTDPAFDASKCTTTTTTNPPPCTFAYCGRRGVCVDSSMVMQVSGNDYTVTAAACVCANDATARATTTGNAGVEPYCEPVKQNLDDASSDAGLVFAPACEGFDCGAHGACVPMNGNPTCQCEAGYGAIATTSYDSLTGAASNKLTCVLVPGMVPKMPVLPPVGQTQIPPSSNNGGTSGSNGTGSPGSGGTSAGTPASGATSATNEAPTRSAQSSSSCNASSRSPSDWDRTLWSALAAAALVGVRRRRSAQYRA